MTSRPRLFSAQQRTDGAPKRHDEGTYEFLDRVNRSWYETVRETLQQWLDEVPVGFASHLANNFQSRRDRQTIGAFWELYLYVLFSRCGFGVSPSPPIGSTGRVADLEVVLGNQPTIVEGTATFDDETDSAAARRLGSAYEALDQTDSPNFFLWIAITQGEGPMPSMRPIRRQLEAWLTSLDPDAVAADVEVHGMRSHLPRLDLTAGSWDLRFEAIPKAAEYRGKPGVRPFGGLRHWRCAHHQDRRPSARCSC